MNTGNRCWDRRLSLYRRGDHSVAAYFVVVIGGVLALFLAIGRVSSNKTSSFQSGYLPIFFAVRRCMLVAGVLFRHVYAGNC